MAAAPAVIVYIVAFVLFHAFGGCYTALRVFTRTPRISTHQGSEVLLDCRFTSDDAVFKFERLIVTWKLRGTKVAEFDDVDKHLQAGAKLFPDELRKGNASLLLRNVAKKDAGTYTCDVLYTPDKESTEISLKVEETTTSGRMIVPTPTNTEKKAGSSTERASGQTALLALMGMLFLLLQ